MKDNKPLETGMEMVEMYKQGFLDGFMEKNGKKGRMYNEKNLWIEIKGKCKIAFEKRFTTKINKLIEEGKK